MEAFLTRRFLVWFLPLTIIYLMPPLITGQSESSLIGLAVAVIWTVLLVQLERRIPRFGKWMHSTW